MSNCNEVSVNSDRYLAYAFCENPVPIVIAGALIVFIVCCISFGCSQEKYSRISTR